MKTNNFYKTCMLFLAMSISMSCSQDDSPGTTKENEIIDPADAIAANISIPEVKALLSGDTMVFESDYIIEGYVVSSDAQGNFQKELYIQDHPSYPTTGIRLVLDKDDLHLSYGLGNKIIIKLQGLYMINAAGDVFTIAQKSEDGMSEISEASISDYIVKPVVAEVISGRSMLFSEISESHIGMYVSVANT